MQRWRALLVGATCAAYALYCAATAPAGPISAPDSAGYLSFSPIRVLGYPAFLHLFGVNAAVALQPLIFAAALAALGIETLRLTSSVAVAIAIVLAPMAVPGLTIYHATILTESLFMSGLIAFLAATVFFMRSPSAGAAAAAGLCAGLTATVRRTGFGLAVVLPLMILVRGRKSPAFVLVALGTALVVIGAERIVARSMHGDRLVSEAGRHLYAKAAMIDGPPPRVAEVDPARAALADHLTVLYQPIRDLLDRAPKDVATILTLYYETCLQGPCVPELGTSSVGSETRRLSGDLYAVGVARIRQAPLQFLELTVRDYRSLWQVYRLSHPDTAPALRAFLDANRPLPFEEQARVTPANMTPPLEPRESVRVAQWAVTLTAWFTAALAALGIGAVVARRALAPDLAAASVAALTAHAGLLLTALFAAGLSRLTLGLWPAVTTAAILGAWSAVHRVFGSQREPGKERER